MKRLLTFEQARERLAVAKSTMWLLLHSGEIRGARKIGAGRGAWRIDPDGLEAYIHAQDRPVTPTPPALPADAAIVKALDADAQLDLPPVSQRRFS